MSPVAQIGAHDWPFGDEDRCSWAPGRLRNVGTPNAERLAPIAVGLGLTLIHLIGIPAENTSVNPAGSTAPARLAGIWATGHLWLFWVAPVIGALLAGWIYPWRGGHGAEAEEG